MLNFHYNCRMSITVTINDLLLEMKTLKEGLAVSLEPLFRNIATQILMVAAGQSVFRQEPRNCDYYSKLGAGHSGIIATAKAMGMQPTSFIAQ